MLESRPALAGLLRPGPFGRPGPVGVRLRSQEALDCVAIAVRTGQGEALTRLLHMAVRLVPPGGPGAVFHGADTLVWSGPGQWLAFRDGPGLADALAPVTPEVAALTPLGDARAVFEVSGPAARSALAKLLAIDLHPRAFHTGSAASTIAAHVGVLVWQTADEPRYRIACYRSFAVALWHALMQAAEAHGGEVLPG